MSADVWVTKSGRALYIDKAALGYERHHCFKGWAGGVAYYTGGSEAAEFLGAEMGFLRTVVDDFGNLVRVPS